MSDKIKSDHATLLNDLHSMSTNYMYALRRQVLRDAEQLIVAQEAEIKRLKALVPAPHPTDRKTANDWRQG